MSEAEKLLEKFARKHMIQWNQESFKTTHKLLHKSIIEAIEEALHLSRSTITNLDGVCSLGDTFCKCKARSTGKFSKEGCIYLYTINK